MAQRRRWKRRRRCRSCGAMLRRQRCSTSWQPSTAATLCVAAPAAAMATLTLSQLRAGYIRTVLTAHQQQFASLCTVGSSCADILHMRCAVPVSHCTCVFSSHNPGRRAPLWCLLTCLLFRRDKSEVASSPGRPPEQECVIARIPVGLTATHSPVVTHELVDITLYPRPTIHIITVDRREAFSGGQPNCQIGAGGGEAGSAGGEGAKSAHVEPAGGGKGRPRGHKGAGGRKGPLALARRFPW